MFFHTLGWPPEHTDIGPMGSRTIAKTRNCARCHMAFQGTNSPRPMYSLKMENAQIGSIFFALRVKEISHLSAWQPAAACQADMHWDSEMGSVWKQKIEPSKKKETWRVLKKYKYIYIYIYISSTSNQNVKLANSLGPAAWNIGDHPQKAAHLLALEGDWRCWKNFWARDCELDDFFLGGVGPDPKTCEIVMFLNCFVWSSTASSYDGPLGGGLSKITNLYILHTRYFNLVHLKKNKMTPAKRIDLTQPNK